MPPERGSAPASSATDSAPHNATMPPNTQHTRIVPGACSCPATVAGTRKIPLPIATPTETAMVCSRLTVRGMRSPHWSATGKSRGDELDPMAYGERGSAAQMRKTADVGRRDELRRVRLERAHLGAQQP